MAVSAREKKLAVVTGALIVLFLLSKVVASPLIARWRSLEQEAAELEVELLECRASVRQKDAIERRYAELVRETRLSGSNEEQIAAVLQNLRRKQREHALTDKGTTVLATEEGGSYHKFRMKVELEGRMEPVAGFLYDVVTDQAPLRVEQLTVRATGGYEVVRASALITAVFATSSDGEST